MISTRLNDYSAAVTSRVIACVIVLLSLGVTMVQAETILKCKEHQISSETTLNVYPRLSIGTNLLYLAALAPNVTAEYYIPNSHWSISGAFTMPWWKQNSKHRFYQIRQYLAEGRYWLKKKPVAQGHFLGVNIHGGLYDLENKKTGYYGEFIGTSLTYGYMHRLNSRLALEFTIGGGYIHTNYDKYIPVDDCYVYQSTHKTHYFGITKAGVSIVWNILYKKR